jgi:nucleotide-binding universal stress UspA family protein
MTMEGDASRGATMRTTSIIAATDGTDPGKAAVRWAAEEAARRGRLLRILHVFDWDRSNADYDYDGHYAEAERQFAESVIVDALSLARTVAPQLPIKTDMLIGRAAIRLPAVTDDAELVVLGSRGRGGFASLLLGSVSQRVATHAPCSVVVVRGRGSVTEGSIAVGIDDSPSDEQVLETAFEAADGRGCALAVVHACQPPIPLWLREAPITEASGPDPDAEQRSRIEDRLAPWRAKYPGVPIKTTLSHESAAAALVEASRGARLVVVGSHNHGILTSTIMGSTGLQLLHHAQCPVYISRPRPEEQAQR